MILDTDFLISLLRKDSSAIEFLESLVESDIDFFITHVNLWELFRGAYASAKRQENLERVSTFFRRFQLLEFSQGIDQRAGTLIAELSKKGTLIGVLDSVIAAVALEHGMPLLTRNVKHFEKTGVVLKTW